VWLRGRALAWHVADCRFNLNPAKKFKIELGVKLSSKALAYHMWSPEFDSQHYKNKK
jgi:hypothetical protein